MIFPNPVNLKKMIRFPLTCTLVGLNVFLFIVAFSSVNFESSAEKSFLKEKMIRRTGYIYQHFMHPADPLTHISETQAQLLGIEALRNDKFILNLEKIEPFGDLIEFEKWKKLALDFRKERFLQPTFQFGLSGQSKNIWPWITYQFSHASWSHLLSNTVYLVILGSAVEILVGSSWLLFIYLLGGVAGGASYLLLNAQGLLPVVGASASISAIMAFYAVYEPRTRVRFFYFLSPLRDHFGTIYLPTLLIIPLYLVSDWASYLGSPQGATGNIAYTAHLGGSLCGGMIAVFLRYFCRGPFFRSLLSRLLPQSNSKDET
jgi:membrane associated rhomboid family serine protease